MSRIEDFKVIDKKNKINDHKRYFDRNSPYPVMYVDKFPVWEGDKLLFAIENGDINIRKIEFAHRGIVSQNPKWIKAFFFDIRKINFDNPLKVGEVI